MKDMEPKEFDERVVHIDRVARVVKGGRRFRFRALVVVGDHKGRVGAGTAKGADVTAAISKATDVAKKNVVKISLYKGTLPHESEAKVAGARIFLKPASPGTGLIAGGVVRVVLEVVGVQNALSKSLGSSNKINCAYATIESLKLIAPSGDWITTKNAPAAKGAKPLEEKPKAVTKKVTEEPATETKKSATPKKPKVSAAKKVVKK